MTCHHSGMFFLVLTCLEVLPPYVGTQEVTAGPDALNQTKPNLVALPSSALLNQTKPNKSMFVNALLRSANESGDAGRPANASGEARRYDWTKLFIDVAKKYGVSHDGLKKAVKEAELHFKKWPQNFASTVTIHISSGHHTINVPTSDDPNYHRSCIDLSELYLVTKPGSGGGREGRLIIQGNGKDKTILESEPGTEFLRGKNVYRLTVKDITFRRSRPHATQGTVKQVGRGFVKLELEKGFPLLKDIYYKKCDGRKGKGKYIRKYKKVNGNCIIVDDVNNKQIPWKSYKIIKRKRSGERFVRIRFNRPWQWAPYKRGDLIGVKSKMCHQNNNVYFFAHGNDVVFENVKFDRQSRGVIRFIDNVRFSHITMTRESKNWCLASSGGGPQIGQPDDPKVTKVTIENLVAENLGDDPVALFNVEGGVIKNCDIKDSFARGIYLENSHSTSLHNNKLERCPILKCKKENDCD